MTLNLILYSKLTVLVNYIRVFVVTLSFLKYDTHLNKILAKWSMIKFGTVNSS